MEKRFELSIKEILEKEFHIDLKGYCANEVDAFLDHVISDYQKYDETIQNLGNSLTKFEEENRKLKNKISELENAIHGKNEIVSNHVENIDIIKRLSRLEKEIFDNK